MSGFILQWHGWMCTVTLITPLFATQHKILISSILVQFSRNQYKTFCNIQQDNMQFDWIICKYNLIYVFCSKFILSDVRSDSSNIKLKISSLMCKVSAGWHSHVSRCRKFFLNRQTVNSNCVFWWNTDQNDSIIQRLNINPGPFILLVNMIRLVMLTLVMMSLMDVEEKRRGSPQIICQIPSLRRLFQVKVSDVTWIISILRNTHVCVVVWLMTAAVWWHSSFLQR